MSQTLIPRTNATMSDVRALEAKCNRIEATLTKRIQDLEIRLNAMHLGSTCHPEWVTPGMGEVAKARRASIVFTVIHSSGRDGMNLNQILSYLHLPKTRAAVLKQDLAWLIESEQIERTRKNSAKWRSKEHNAT